MSTLKTIVMTLVVVGAAAQVWAAEVPRDQTQNLAAAKQKVAQAYDQARGAKRALLSMEKLRLQQLIDDLQAGKHVNPADIDRALQAAERDAR